MTRVKIKTCTENISVCLEAIPDLKRVMRGATLKETIPETPAIQVYFDSKDVISPGGTDRYTMGGGKNGVIRKTAMIIHVDVYARQRSNIGDEMALLEELIDLVDDVMEQQGDKPYFGIDGVQAYSYRAERTTFEYNKNDYVGVRFYVTLTLF